MLHYTKNIAACVTLYQKYNGLCYIIQKIKRLILHNTKNLAAYGTLY